MLFRSERVARELEASPKTSPTAAGPAETSRNEPTAVLVDVINQVFALFRLNYHNQYYSAWGDDQQLAQVKKLWLEALANLTPEQILRGAKRCIETSDYLPSLHKMLECCRAMHGGAGLSDAHTSYMEACTKPSPKAEQSWSHPVVYLAGRDSGWFFLANSAESVGFPIFRQHFEQYCAQIGRAHV